MPTDRPHYSSLDGRTRSAFAAAFVIGYLLLATVQFSAALPPFIKIGTTFVLLSFSGWYFHFNCDLRCSSTRNRMCVRAVREPIGWLIGNWQAHRCSRSSDSKWAVLCARCWPSVNNSNGRRRKRHRCLFSYTRLVSKEVTDRMMSASSSSTPTSFLFAFLPSSARSETTSRSSSSVSGLLLIYTSSIASFLQKINSKQSHRIIERSNKSTTCERAKTLNILIIVDVFTLD